MGIQKKVVLKSVSTVVPATPTRGERRYFLSNLDQVFVTEGYVNTAWYFKPGDDQFTAHVFESLRMSLSRVLVHYPVLAGRICKGEHGKFEVDLNDKGVVFREAVTNARFDDWEDIKDCTIEGELNAAESLIEDFSNSPLMKIQVLSNSLLPSCSDLFQFLQVTSFQCGGIVLGFSMAHGTEDGWAAIEFVKSWSEVHTGLPISTPPVYASHLMKAREPPVVSVPVIKDYVSLAKQDVTISANEVLDKTAASPYQAITFRFSAEQVDAIVQEVASGPWKLDKLSSFLAMAAFTWKVITEARELPDSTLTRYVYPISCRHRWEPRLPDGYFGNTVHISSVPAKAGDIKNNHVSFAAKLISDDLANISSEYLRSVVDWMELELQDGRIGFACDSYSGWDVQSTSMVNFPIFDVDFGWGRLVHYSHTFQPIQGDGHAYLFPAPQGGRSRLVPIYLKRSAMKQLFSNELFRTFQPSLRSYDYY